MRDQRDAGRNQFGPGGFDFERAEFHAMVGAGDVAILELRLGDCGSKVHVPERRRFDLIREAALELVQERQLRHALRFLANRGVGHRPVHRQAQISPQRFERLFVLVRQSVAQLDEVRPRHRDRRLGRLGRRRERRIVGQRRIAAHAVVVLHAAFGRQAVVVPPHRVEHLFAAHPLKASDQIGVRCTKRRDRHAAIR
jgi:hypothetical protein